MKKILIIGATSAIAEATARIYAEQGNELFLVARNEKKLQGIVADLSVRGGKNIGMSCVDLTDYEVLGYCVGQAIGHLQQLDIVLIAHGTLSDQVLCQQSVEVTLEEVNTNAISFVVLMTLLANLLEKQGHGTIAVISSVAGDRGRKSNYVYGASKAMVSAFLDGLRNRLFSSGAHVLTIKPGFVDTPMTASFKKGLLWAQP